MVDANSTIDQGEGPWNNSVPGVRVRTVRPELLMVGRNPVAVDAVGPAVMGFDPTAKARQAPFPFTCTPNSSADSGHALHMAMCAAVDHRV